LKWSLATNLTSGYFSKEPDDKFVAKLHFNADRAMFMASYLLRPPYLLVAARVSEKKLQKQSKTLVKRHLTQSSIIL
jgi:hypothetical protein